MLFRLKQFAILFLLAILLFPMSVFAAKPSADHLTKVGPFGHQCTVDLTNDTVSLGNKRLAVFAITNPGEEGVTQNFIPSSAQNFCVLVNRDDRNVTLQTIKSFSEAHPEEKASVSVALLTNTITEKPENFFTFLINAATANSSKSTAELYALLVGHGTAAYTFFDFFVNDVPIVLPDFTRETFSCDRQIDGSLEWDSSFDDDIDSPFFEIPLLNQEGLCGDGDFEGKVKRVRYRFDFDFLSFINSQTITRGGLITALTLAAGPFGLSAAAGASIVDYYDNGNSDNLSDNYLYFLGYHNDFYEGGYDPNFPVDEYNKDCPRFNGDQSQCNEHSAVCQWVADENTCVRIGENNTDNPETITPEEYLEQQEEEHKLDEQTYEEYKRVSGILPECAFAGSCNDVNDLLLLGVNVGGFVFKFIGAVSFIFVAIGGLLMTASFGNASRFQAGQKALVAAIIGLAIASGAYFLIDQLLIILGVDPTFRPL